MTLNFQILVISYLCKRYVIKQVKINKISLDVKHLKTMQVRLGDTCL